MCAQCDNLHLLPSGTRTTVCPRDTHASLRYSDTTRDPNNRSKTVSEKGLEIVDVQVGTGTEATSGQNVTVHYTGWLTNGTKFDSSVDRGKPFSFPLGGGRVIKGWDQGVAGMKEGGKRRLTIPPEFGYGARGAGKVIPPHSTLIFDVELLKVG